LLRLPDEAAENAMHCVDVQDHKIDKVLDKELIAEAEKAISDKQPVIIERTIQNTDRTTGAMLSGTIAGKYGSAGLPDGTIKYQPYLLQGGYVNWELRYPIKVMGSTRGKFYVADFIDEMHVGFAGRELTLAGSVFDLRMDYMFNSPVRNNQFVMDITIQKIFDYWAYSSIAIGPSLIVSNLKNGNIGFTSVFLNLRIKVGTSL